MYSIVHKRGAPTTGHWALTSSQPFPMKRLKDVRMESQGKGRHAVCADNVNRFDLWPQLPLRPHRRLRILAIWLLCSAFVWLGGAQAQSNSYTYDANGRVVAVTQNNSISAQYSYDTMGNLVQISTVPAGQLAIFAFMPTHGMAGTQVVITGLGFSSNPASDSVSFNGVAASVLSASSTQLVVSVPSGATTGPISVTAGGQTATSATPFVVDNTGFPPTISQVSPTVVTVGGTLTTTGAHLDPVSGETTIQLGGQQLPLTTASDTQLQSVVPTNASSGHVVVQTPYGNATSATPVAVLPSGVASANVVSSGYATPNGSSANLTMGAAGQMGVVLFDGTVGGWLSLQSSNFSTSNGINYVIYAPGNVIVQQGTISSGTPSIHLPQMTVGGTYLATFQATTAGTQLTVSVEANASVAPGLPVNMSTAASLQSKRFLFTAMTGQNLELTLNGLNVGAGTNVTATVYVYSNIGALAASSKCYTSSPAGSCIVHVWSLAGGTYSVIAVPNSAGVMGFNTILTTDVVMPSLAFNSPVALTFTPGQVRRFTFTAQAGQTVALQASASTTPTAGATLSIYRPDAGVITASTPTYASFDTSSGPLLNLSNLPVSGTYTVIVTPDYGLAATATLNLVPGVSSSLPINGASTNYTANASGQNVYFTVTASQGENLELSLNHVTVTGGAGSSVNVTIFNGAGVQVAYFSCYATSPAGSCIQHQWNMAAGTYTVVVAPTQPTGVISFNALVQDDIIGPSIATNGSVALSLGAGQVERLTFNANAGDTVALNISGVTTAPVGQGVTLLVYRPDAGTLNNTTASYVSFDSVNAPTANLVNLPVSGTYTVVVVPDYGLPMNAQVSVLSGVTGTLLTNGASQSYATHVSVQGSYLTFTAQQGDNLELTLSGVSISGPAGVSLNIQVTNANGQQVVGFTCTPTSTVTSCTQHLWSMAAGTYSVAITPYSGGTYTFSFNAQLQSDLAGPDLAANSPVGVNLTMGQVERLTFNANAGDTVALQLSGVATTPSLGQTGVKFLIYRPDAGVITNATAAYTSIDTVGSATINLPSLPVSGAYTVIVAPDSGLPTGGQLGLIAGVTGAVPSSGTQQSYATSSSGQNVYLSFTAQQGANLELTLNNLNMAGPGSKVVVLTVYSATGVQVASMYCYQTSPGGSCMQPLWYLPAGTYSAVVSPYSGNSGGTMSFNALLQPDVMGPSLLTPGSTGVLLGPGQVQRLTFSANAGDTVALQVSGVSTSPAGGSVNLAVYRPDVGAITLATTSYSALSSSGTTQTVTLSNLPVSGVYTIIVTPQYGLPANAQVSLLSDTPGTPPAYSTPTLTNNGVAQNEAATGMGQSVTMTFNANAGDNLELVLSAINVPGATSNGFRVDVYNPSGTDIQGSYCYASNPGASCRAALWNLVAGTYKVVVSPTWGGTMNFNAQLTPDVVGPTLAPSTPTTLNLAQGVVERITFSANVGDTVALNLSGVTTTPSGQPVYIAVYRPDTGAITTAYTSTSTTSSTILNLPNLPASGTYTVVAYTVYGEPGSATLTLLSGVTGSLSKNGPSQNLAASANGQNIYASFNASLGDNLELTLGNLMATNGSALSVGVQVFGPAGNQVAYVNCSSSYPGGDCRIPLWNLAAGTYSIIATPQSSVTMSFSALLLSDITGPSLTANSPINVNLGVGQVQRLTFSANAGNTVALSLASVGTTPSGQYVYVNIYRPDAGALTAYNYYTTTYTAGSAVINLPNLPVSGTYTVVVYTNYGQAGQAALNLLPGITGTVPTGGVSPTYATSVTGQNAYLSFTANPGDNLELTFSNVVGYSFTANVYGPSGAQIGTMSCNGSNPGASCTTPLWNLGGGTYSVVVSGSTFSFNAQVMADLAGPTLLANTPTIVNLGQGQAERFTFNANKGDTVAVALSGVTTTPAGQYVYVFIYRPDTGLVTPAYNGSNYAYLSTTTEQTVNLPNLPVSGTYTVVVVESSYGVPASAQLTLTSGLTGTLSSDGTVQSFAATSWNDNYYMTFNANSGDNLELAFSNLSVPQNTFTSGININLYDANGKTVSTFGGCSGTPVCLYSFWNLAGGSYHVVVSPGFNGMMNFNAQLTPDVIGPVLTPGVPAAINLPQGRVERLTFNATIGQSATLNLSGLATTPAGQPMYVNVYRPDGGAIVTNANGSAMASNYYAQLATSSPGTLNLPNLPASGSYTVVVSDINGVPGNAQLTLTMGMAVMLTSDGTVQTSVLNSTSQSGYLGFNANAGDNLELTLSNIIATNNGNGVFLVNVYDANGGNVANFTCDASSPGASCSQSLWNLIAGTYSVVVSSTQAGTIQFDTKLQKDLVGGVLAANTPMQIGPSTDPVQRLTFNANAGDNLSLQLSNVNTSPAGQNVTVYVFCPDVGTITTSNAYAQASSNSAKTLSLPSLPVSGTYTVVVSMDGGLPGAALLDLVPQ